MNQFRWAIANWLAGFVVGIVLMLLYLAFTDICIYTDYLWPGGPRVAGGKLCWSALQWLLKW